MLLTSYTKIVVVLSLLRSAIGVQQSPPNQVLNGIALLMTIYVMYPTGLAMYNAGGDYIKNNAPQELLTGPSATYILNVADKTKEPLREFLQRNTMAKHMSSFYQLAYRSFPEEFRQTLKPTDFIVLIPAYITSQLKAAFEIGVLIDFLRGSSSLMVTDPFMQTQISPIGLLYNYVLIALFFQIGGPFIFLEGFLQSYAIIPADAFLSPTLFTLAQPFWQTLMSLVTKFTALSIQLAAPPLVAILMAEMFLGIANRLAPQVQIAFLGMSIKSLLGIALLFAGWFFILQQTANQALLWLQEMSRLLQYLSV